MVKIEMPCPLDVNNGFIELIGPIQQADLNNITNKTSPLSIAFSPRTIPSALIGNRIDESTDNRCTYKGDVFNLVDVQICSVTNKGYTLPGQTNEPVAELVISFKPKDPSPKGTSIDLSGILLCIPIYDSGNPSHAEYLNQFIQETNPDEKTNIPN